MVTEEARPYSSVEEGLRRGRGKSILPHVHNGSSLIGVFPCGTLFIMIIARVSFSVNIVNMETLRSFLGHNWEGSVAPNFPHFLFN